MKSKIVKIFITYLFVCHISALKAEIASDKKPNTTHYTSRTFRIDADENYLNKFEDNIIQNIIQLISPDKTTTATENSNSIPSMAQTSTINVDKNYPNKSKNSIIQRIIQLIYPDKTTAATENPNTTTSISQTSTIDTDQYASMAFYQSENPFMQISRPLTNDEIFQINTLPNNFGIDRNNVRIIDLESILNCIEKYLGKERIQYYRDIAENPNMLMLELERFFEEYPIRIVMNNWTNWDAIKGCDTKETHDQNKKKCIQHMISTVKTSIVKESMDDRLIINKSIMHHLTVFIAVNEFRLKTNPLHHSLSFSFSDNMHPMVKYSRTIEYTLDSNEHRMLNKSKSSSDIELPFPQNFSQNAFFICSSAPELSDTSLRTHSFGIGISKENLDPIFHEFGHFWYKFISLQMYGYKIEHHDCFEDFSSSGFLRKMFPMCENHIFSANDIDAIIIKEYHNNLKAFRLCVDNILTNASANINVQENDIISEENLDRIFNSANSERNNAIASLFNSIIHCYIWGNNSEIAQVFGLEKIDNIIFVNRLSDFDHHVNVKNPFNIVYHHGLDDEFGIHSAMEPEQAHKKFYEAYQITSDHYKKLILRTILRIKELQDMGIETIIPSENALRAMFVLHGKDYDDYKNEIHDRKEFKIW